jgi:microcystin-dependent protein
MPSTFSPNLRIELIGNGEQAGNWGSTTNTNLGTLVEDAISGYETVSVTTANQAFTHADGAADQARNAMIELTTTTGAVFNVYAPPSPKLYVIYNASAHAATVFNSTVVGNTTAAGTGVAVPAGRRIFVMSDGTDFSLVTPPASSVNTPNTLVERDGSGDFAAGTITASLTGNVTGNVTGNASGSAATLATPRTLSIGGAGKTFNGSADVTWTATEINANLPGAVFYFAMNTAPTGYLKANGALVSRATYAALFAAIGTTFGAGDGSTTFALPDLRGEFIRGWDDGRGVDSGRAFGTFQDQAFASHSHGVVVRHDFSANTPNPPFIAGTNINNQTNTLSTNAAGGSETRPRNVALLACIKF